MSNLEKLSRLLSEPTTNPVQYRMLNGEWQVYTTGLQHVCMCLNENIAEMICDAINQRVREIQSSLANNPKP